MAERVAEEEGSKLQVKKERKEEEEKEESKKQIIFAEAEETCLKLHSTGADSRNLGHAACILARRKASIFQRRRF